MTYRELYTALGVEFECYYKYYDGAHEENPKIEVELMVLRIGNEDATGLLMCEEIEQKLVEEIKKAHEK